MDRVAIFVDAGHVYAGGSAALTGEAKKRSEMTIDAAKITALLQDKAKKISGLPLLRIYWYDGLVSGRLSTDQTVLAGTENVKLRLGIVNTAGEQKGVDARIVTDLADLARNSAICDAILIGGDEDLRIGVELAQDRGVRVHLLTVESTNVSQDLRYAADTVSQISKAEVAGFLSVNPATVPPAPQARPAPRPAATAMGDALAQAMTGAKAKAPATATQPTVEYAKVVREYLDTLSAPEVSALKSALATSGSIPREHDARILARARDSIRRDLDIDEKKALRTEVRTQGEAK